MKKFMVVLCFFLLVCCSSGEFVGDDIIVSINYPNSHLVAFTNTYNSTSKMFIVEEKGNYNYTREELEEKIDTLNVLNLQVFKIIENNEDNEDLIITVYVGNEVYVNTLPINTTKIILNYVF